MPLIGAVAAQQFDVLDWQKQLAAIVVQLEAIVRRTGDIDGLQALIAPHSVIDMGNEIARREAGSFREKILRPLGAAALRHHAVAENVLFGDDGAIRRLEAALQPDNTDPDSLAV